MRWMFLACILFPVRVLFTESEEIQTSLNFSFAPKQDVRIDLQREEVFLYPNQTYDLTWTEEITLLTQNGLLNNQTMSSPSYFPKQSSVELLEAYVTHPDGTKIAVPPENVYTTTSPSDPLAPGFDTALIQSIAFPQLMIGSKLHVKWKYRQIEIPDFPFADVIFPDFDTDTLLTEISINVPEEMHLAWAQSGEFEYKEAKENGRHIVSAVLGPQAGRPREAFMPEDSDLLPFFEVTTLSSWEEIGNTIYRLSEPNFVVTPQIKKLAEEIVGTKKGKEAAQAIYNWTAQNIFYLEVMLSPRQGIVSQTAEQILFNRFGDCKAHSTVLITLLKAIGITAFPVVVSWDNSLLEYPLPIPSFDHEMVYIPELDLFANPTSPYARFTSPLDETNFSSEGLQVLANKPILIAMPESSKYTKTPQAVAAQNRYIFQSSIKMDLQGNMISKGSIGAMGVFDSVLRGFLSEGPSPADLLSDLAFANGFEGKAAANVLNLDNLDSPLKIEYGWEGEHVTQPSGEDLLFQVPSMIDLFTSKFFLQFLSTTGSRSYPLIIGSGIYEWSYSIEIPEGYLMKKKPANVNMINPAGSYIVAYSCQEKTLQIHKKLEILKNVYSPEEYANIAMLLTQWIQDAYFIFHLTPIPVEDFPGIPH